jgi:hypothetical protein
MHKAKIEVISSMTPNPPEGFMALNKAISFQNDSVFGREQVDVDYAIADDYVSRKHFQIAFMGDEAYLTDLNSRHGTYLNGERIAKSTRLNSGDTIRVGKTSFSFELELAKKTSRHRPALASCDQPAIVSLDGGANPSDYSHLREENSLQDHPTDIDMPLMMDGHADPAVGNGNIAKEVKKGAESGKLESHGGHDKEKLAPSEVRRPLPKPTTSAAAPVDESGLEIQRPDSQPQFEYDPNDNPLFPDIISTDSHTESKPAAGDSEEDGPVFIDDFEVGELPLTKPISQQPNPTPVVDMLPEKLLESNEELTGEIPLAEALRDDVGGWKQLSSGWFDYAWGDPKSPLSLCEALDEVGQLVSMWAIVHFGKFGSSTPWSLGDCQPIWNGIPEPLAKAYGPVIVPYISLRKALKPEVISKLWNAGALLLIGGENASVIQQGFRERLWLRPQNADTDFREYPMDSSVFWRLWAQQGVSGSQGRKPLWEPHISVVLLGGDDNVAEMHVLARKQLNLRRIT